ncbi:hypothetical protein AMTR_s05169p00002110 [Amborella trichopoda]|uniref:Uncharacterized protein n=1 Tax=Amborella trichopoda TaxID=13333 RepID=U5CVT8_AMBTC|nr:hypothetical protein AMTR_s05169p00002110 [Amborella trichopoda]
MADTSLLKLLHVGFGEAPPPLPNKAFIGHSQLPNPQPCSLIGRHTLSNLTRLIRDPHPKEVALQPINQSCHIGRECKEESF